MPILNQESKRSSRWRKYEVEALIILVGLAAINFIFISGAFRQTHTVDTESAARLGSFVGGYVGSFFALVGVVLLYSTLKGQRRASETQHFETKYFELIKMHRDNVAELDIQGASGSRVFVLMIRELRCVLEILRRIAREFGQELS